MERGLPRASRRVAVLFGGRVRFSVVVLVLLVFASSTMAAPAAHADELRDAEYWLTSEGITKAWDVSRGKGVTVAVIDSGVDGTHQDLQGVVVGGTDVSGAGASNGQKTLGVEPVHGTLVASVLAGRGHGTPAKGQTFPNPAGVLGVAPEAQILSISAWLGSANPAGKSIDEQIPAAVRWAVDHGAKVINMSLGSTSTGWPQSWDSAFQYAERKDVVIVAAAGNRQAGMAQAGAPATIPGVLAVGGLAKDGTASKEASTQGITIGVSAAAENLVGALPGNGYAYWSGSSAATPIVAGVAALIRAKYPDMSAAQVINRIIRTAKPTGPGSPNATYGYGTLNAEAALKATVPVVSKNPLGSITDWMTVHRRATAPASAAPSRTLPAPQTQQPLPPATTPAALAPAQLNSVLPMALVLGFSALILLMLVGGIVHVGIVRKAGRAPRSHPQEELPPAS